MGRRISKSVQKPNGENKIFRYIWDGNTLLHEWSYNAEEKPQLIVDDKGLLSYTRAEPLNNLTTWVYEEGTLYPSAKISGENTYSIISDYLGTPYQAYNKEGSLIWERELDIYGEPIKGNHDFVPFIYQGQYYDKEIELAYNRFRYYNPQTGSYISQDPIGIAGNNPNLYAYTSDSNLEVDPWGLNPILVDPNTIFFSQNNIKGAFTDGTPIERAINNVKANPSIAANFNEPIRLIKLEDLPPSIQSKLKNQGAKTGDVFSLDNRRLFVAQQAGASKINARFVTQADLIKEAKLKEEKPINLHKRFSTDNAGRGIKVRCP